MIDMNRKVLSRISGDLLLNEPYLPRMSQCGANILETVTAITVLGVVGCHGFIQLSRDEVMVCQWSALTHWGRVTHICVNKLTIIGSDNDLSPGRQATSHYLNQCWNIVNWTLGNKLQWYLNRNSYILIQENAFEYVVRKLAAILSRPQCVNILVACHVGRWM